MRLISLVVFISVLGFGSTQIFAAETNKNAEADLDAIMPKKKTEAGKATGKTQDESKLSKYDPIVLKENATQADVIRYLKKLLKVWEENRAAAKEHVMSNPGIAVSERNERQVLNQKLNAIPSAFIREMLEVGEGKERYIRFRIVSLINGRTDLDESHKESILKQLPENPELIETVTTHGWEKGAEATIIKTVNKSGYLNTTPFVPILAAYGTPASKKALIELLTTKQPEQIVRNIATLDATGLEGLDMENIVVKAWKSVQNASGNDIADVAPLAAQYGCLDALLVMAKRLNGTPNGYVRDDNKIRMNYLDSLNQLVPDAGSDEKALVKYILANRTKLVFDKTLKEYRVVEQPNTAGAGKSK